MMRLLSWIEIYAEELSGPRVIASKATPMLKIQEPEKALIPKNIPTLTTMAKSLDSKHDLVCAIGRKSGYRIVGGQKLALHNENEDVSYPPCDSFTQFSSNLNKSKLFLLADGHGGVGCPNFIIERARALIENMFEWKEWNLAVLEELGIFKRGMEDIFKLVDQEFCAAKAQEFQRFKVGELKKPTDDGCTLVANIILVSAFGKWFINCNVGDSRTIVNTLEPVKDAQPIFVSNDHNMHHKSKMRHIAQNGGKFLSSMALFIDPVYIETLSPTCFINPLCSSRIFRPDSAQLTAAGVSHKRTLNLTSTMGDYLFKVEPAVICNKPDITVVDLDRERKPLFILAATDGLYDNLKTQDCEAQVHLLSEFIRTHIKSSLCLTDEIEECVRLLVERSPICESKMFATDRKRIDDVCCQLLLIP